MVEAFLDRLKTSRTRKIMKLYYDAAPLLDVQC